MKILAKTGSGITCKGARAPWIPGISGKLGFSGAERLPRGAPLQVLSSPLRLTTPGVRLYVRSTSREVDPALAEVVKKSGGSFEVLR
jgi:hypothetical protein